MLFFFSSLLLFSQESKLKVKLNNITTLLINAKNTEYFINYEITNTTNNEISFFLIPNALIANAASSGTLFMVYKMYQNGLFEDMDGPFFEYGSDDVIELATIEDKNSEKYKLLLQKIIDKNKVKFLDIKLKYNIKSDNDAEISWAFRNYLLVNSIIKLNPNETRKFTIKTLWDKNRFVKNDDLEYYLDENKKIEIELILQLNKKVFKDRLSTQEYKAIETDENFIEGDFKSNKLEVKFDE